MAENVKHIIIIYLQILMFLKFFHTFIKILMIFSVFILIFYIIPVVCTGFLLLLLVYDNQLYRTLGASH